MLLSRFWYFILSFALAASAGILFTVQHYYNRNAERWLVDAVTADSSAVGWYLKDDARNRATALLPIALSQSIREGLTKASESDEVPKEAREKVRVTLQKLGQESDPQFTALWAVDADGRVIGDYGWQHKADWNLGGFSIVADALAGWIRDDAWVLKEKLYRVVARPVERDGGGEPVGAIIGLTAMDDTYAAAVSQRTGAAVAFFAMGTRVATGAPIEFRKADLDIIQSDLKEVIENETDYNDPEKGRSKVRRPAKDLGIVYAKMNGEARDLQSGYAVGRNIVTFPTPLSFLDKAEKQDTDAMPKGILGGIAIGLGLLGILFTIFEHTRPLGTFRREALRLAKGEVDQLAPSRFRGLYKKIASDLNDGIEKVSAKGGVPRRAADLDSVLGPMPAQPAMSAFAVPEASPSNAGPPPSDPKPMARPSERRVPGPPPGRPSAPQGSPVSPPTPLPGFRTPVGDDDATVAMVPRPPIPNGPRPPAPAPSRARAEAPPAPAIDAPFDEIADWKRVYEEYLNVRRQCGEPTDSLTFDKFKSTLERNKSAIVTRHNCTRVKFTVYIKDGKAALKASPVK